MSETLAAWAVMQALVNVNITINTEVLIAFWASNRKAKLVAYDKITNKSVYTHRQRESER